MKASYLDFNTRAIADLVPCSDHQVITRINVPSGNRALRHGTRLLQRILDDADREHITLRVQPVATGEMPQRALVKWYRKHGFVRVTSYGTMERRPASTVVRA